MRKWITLLMTFLVGSCASYANASTGQVTLEAGYRHDNINWRTRFPSDSPFLKTNTRFKDVEIFQINAHGRSTIGCNFYIRGNAYWGWVLEGDFEHSMQTYVSPFFESSESGYSNNNNINLGFSAQRHNVLDDKWVYGIGGAIGYPFYMCDCTMMIAPVIGYAIDEQNFELNDHGFDLEESGCAFFPVSGSQCCDKKWISRWFGPFAGIDLSYRPCNDCWNVFAELEYHFGYFQGKRHADVGFQGFGFDSRKFHSHQATGWVFCAGFDYDLCNCWDLGLAFKFQDWSATRHHRRDDSFDSYAYFSDLRGRERHNFKWHSYEIKFALGKDF
jgi:opacity protein-like surface antigen